MPETINPNEVAYPKKVGPPRGRPIGSLNRPSAMKTGPKPARTKPRKRYSDAEIAQYKAAMLDLFDMGQIKTLTEGARILGISPTSVHGWVEHDHDWAWSIRKAKEVIADALEKKLLDSNNDVAAIFLLKGYRPEFRDTYHVNVTSDTMEKLLKELRALGQKPQPTVPALQEPVIEVLPIDIPIAKEEVDVV